MSFDLSYEYIRGLTEGEGTFTFSTSTINGRKIKIPSFAIKMHHRDKELLESVRDKLGLKNKIYVYDSHDDKINRAPQAMLIVREIGRVRNIIVPLFYKKLKGNKKIQFEAWMEKIKDDPCVPYTYKIIPVLCKNGYYDANHLNYF